MGARLILQLVAYTFEVFTVTMNGDYNGLGEKLANLPLNGLLVIAFSCVTGTHMG